MNDATHVHLDDDAEAYALGTLDERGSARVEAAVASCDVCAARVGEAESTVALLVVPRDVPTRSATRASWPWLAIAAAFVIGLLPSAYLIQRASNDANARAVAMTALVHSHFLHAPFAALASDAPHAKAIYARDGSWLYIVSDAPRALTVVAEPGDRVVGTLAPAGSAAALFVTGSARERVLELRDGTLPIARVTLVF